MMKYALFFSLIIVFLIFSCKKENTTLSNTTTNPPTAIVLDTAFHFSVDSCCLMLPNMFTPNGDGLNDLFIPSQRNFDSCIIQIFTSANILIHSDTNFISGWDGTVPNANPSRQTGFYKYTLTAKTSSGVHISFIGRVYLNTDVTVHCISNSVAPKMSDMMDPNACGFLYVSNEHFCFQ